MTLHVDLKGRLANRRTLGELVSEWRCHQRAQDTAQRCVETKNRLKKQARRMRRKMR